MKQGTQSIPEGSAPVDSDQRGSGDFSIGSKLWPGTSKLLEEMGELQQVLGKLIAVAGATDHWSGDLRTLLVEELGDTAAAIEFFITENFTDGQQDAIGSRMTTKLFLFRAWHAAGLPTVSGISDGSGEQK